MKLEYETQIVNGPECIVRKLFYANELHSEEQIVNDKELHW